MKIYRPSLRLGETETLEEKIDFSHVDFKNNQIKEIKNCIAKARVTDYGEIIRVEIHIDALLVAICSYSLEDVDLGIKVDESFNFSNEEDGSSYYEPEEIIDLDPYILSLILSEVPIKIVKKGKQLPEGGEGYRVLSERDYQKEKLNKKESSFDVLDQIDLDEQ